MGKGGGGEWEVDGRNFIFCCSPVGPVLDNCEFLRASWDGGGSGDGSGKWMAATLNSVVAAGPVLDNCEFLRAPWDGGGRGDGSGKWMAATLNPVDSPRGLFSTFVNLPAEGGLPRGKSSNQPTTTSKIMSIHM